MSCIRRLVHEGQKPRPLQEKAVQGRLREVAVTPRNFRLAPAASGSPPNTPPRPLTPPSQPQQKSREEGVSVRDWENIKSGRGQAPFGGGTDNTWVTGQ